MPAGLIRVEIETDEAGKAIGGVISAPQPLTVGEQVPPATIAACVGLDPADIVLAEHPPLLASVGNPFIIAQVTDDAPRRCVPNVGAFRAAVAARPAMNGRFSLRLYARSGPRLRARMFAPLAGTFEDPATGSANAPLGALLLSLGEEDEANFEIRQGEEMGRPSLLLVGAKRADDGIRATVAGRCVPVLRGEAILGDEGLPA